MSRKGKVLVAMSGGIDSTITALMLHDQGYEVVGITMKTWDYVATGHYGNIHQHENGRFYISKGVDELKDQSYVLWGLQQDLLSRTLLPLGTYHKTEIRQMALDYGYPELAK